MKPIIVPSKAAENQPTLVYNRCTLGIADHLRVIGVEPGNVFGLAFADYLWLRKCPGTSDALAIITEADIEEACLFFEKKVAEVRAATAAKSARDARDAVAA